MKAKRTTTVSELFAGPVRDFSIYNNVRSIPHVVDGFKVTMRKAYHGMRLKAPSIPEGGIKVAQVASFIAEVTSYHHGEGSVAGVIVNMAQDFPGANNLPHFKAIGQFGSRLSKGAGAARYIFTDISKLSSKIFLKDDDIILEYLEEDGDKIEPRYFLPILPNILINGSSGMATGHAVEIACYNPEDLKEYILAKLNGRKAQPLVPWYKGFKGKVERGANGKQVVITGVIEKVNSTTLRITELPPGWQEDDYKELLNRLEDEGVIKGYDNQSTAAGWDITITVPRTLGYAEQEELNSIFKLTSRMTENLTVWLPTGKLKKFSSPEALVDYFIAFRLTKFEERRVALLKRHEDQLVKLNERLRFIRYYLDGDNAQQFSRRTKAQMQETLLGLKFTTVDALIDIPLYRLTKDEIEKLEREIAEVAKLVKYYQEATPAGLYSTDLKALDLSKEL